jgi:hypothetical protein
MAVIKSIKFAAWGVEMTAWKEIDAALGQVGGAMVMLEDGWKGGEGKPVSNLGRRPETPSDRPQQSLKVPLLQESLGTDQRYDWPDFGMPLRRFSGDFSATLNA